MSGGHDHGHHRAAHHVRPLAIAFALGGVFMVVELVAGLWTGSLALVSDAGHMATDTIGLGMSLAAIVTAARSRRNRAQTFGLYRAEIIAALFNAVLLFGVAGYVLIEAVQRIGEPQQLQTGPMLVVATGGLVVNVFAWVLLRRGASESLNVEGAYLEVLADLLGSVGVLFAGGVIAVTGWSIVDPLVAAAIGVFILPRAWRLASEAVRILIQAAPPGLDLAALEDELRAIEGVVDAHDLHVWTLTSNMDVGTVHMSTPDGTDPHPVLDRARAILEAQGIAHATLQVEPTTHQGCAELTW